jgi:hypothetical protein
MSIQWIGGSGSEVNLGNDDSRDRLSEAELLAWLVLMVTHDPNAAKRAHRIVLMAAGLLVDGSS